MTQGTCWLLFPLIFIHKVTSFNIDTRTSVVYSHPTGQTNGYFGFSVTIHAHRNTRWLIVGAPKANVTSSDGNPLTSFGAVFKCDINETKSCSLIPVDNSPEEVAEFPYNGGFPYVPMESKSGQWLGGTVQSMRDSDNLLVCAPRYSHKQDARHEKKLFNGPKLNNFPSGRCFLLHSNLSGVEDILQPCKRQSNNPYNGYCQLGLSAASIDNSSSVVMGVVGLGNDTARLVYTGGVERYSPESRAFAVSLFDQRLKRDDYMGYGVAVLRFENTTGIAGGAPRGDNLEGKVFIYEDRKDGIVFQSTLERPKDSQVGSYFGSSVCAVDLNNDGLTDLLVGAPLFTMTMDEGRVYVYISNKDGVLSWAKSMTLTGDSVPGARFGFALADAGDLNRDGFHDVVVGAPYEGPNSEGAVYVYHGNKQGIQNRYQQKIFASSLSSSLRGFGCSVSGAVDVDYNGYPGGFVGIIIIVIIIVSIIIIVIVFILIFIAIIITVIIIIISSSIVILIIIVFIITVFIISIIIITVFIIFIFIYIAIIITDIIIIISSSIVILIIIAIIMSSLSSSLLASSSASPSYRDH